MYGVWSEFGIVGVGTGSAIVEVSVVGFVVVVCARWFSVSVGGGSVVVDGVSAVGFAAVVCAGATVDFSVSLLRLLMIVSRSVPMFAVEYRLFLVSFAMVLIPHSL